MNTRLTVASICCLFVLCISAARGAETQARITDRPWRMDCKDGHCYLSMSARVQDQTSDNEVVILAVDVLQASRAAEVVQVILPPDVTKGEEVSIRFVDSKPDGASFKLTEAGDMYALPINNCRPGGCASVVHPMLDNGNGPSLDLFLELQRHDFLWVMFQRQKVKEPTRVLIPIYKFREAVSGVESSVIPR